MYVVNSIPDNNSELVAGNNIILKFSKQINPSTFTDQMLYIEQNGIMIDYSYSINNDELILTLKNYKTGKCILYLSGADLIANKFLSQTDGSRLSKTFSMQFNIVVSSNNTGQERNEDQQNIPIVILDDKATKVDVQYPKVLLFDTFNIRFSKNIVKPFEVTIVIDQFNQQPLEKRYVVSNNSNFIAYNQNIVNVMLEFPTNSVVYIITDPIEFENDITESFTLIMFSRLQPYVNMALVKQQLGVYQKNITDEEVYYQCLSQIAKLEEQTNTQIFGQQLTQSQRVFVQKYQYLELLESILNKRVGSQNISVDTGVQVVSYGSVNQTQLEYIRQQKFSVENDYIRIKPGQQSINSNYDYSTHSKALQQIKLFEDSILMQQIDSIKFGGEFKWKNLI